MMKPDKIFVPPSITVFSRALTVLMKTFFNSPKLCFMFTRSNQINRSTLANKSYIFLVKLFICMNMIMIIVDVAVWNNRFRSKFYFGEYLVLPPRRRPLCSRIQIRILAVDHQVDLFKGSRWHQGPGRSLELDFAVFENNPKLSRFLVDPSPDCRRHRELEVGGQVVHRLLGIQLVSIKYLTF